jgi:glycosyltransferase involved in cell wall biosynthesis
LDGVFTNSKKTAEVLRRAHPWLEGKDVEVIYNPAPPQENRTEPGSTGAQPVGSHEDKIIVLSLGRLDRDKGHIHLVEAFGDVVSDCPNARLIIAGEGPERRALEKRVCELELSNSVDFFGFAEYPDVLYRIADVFVMPSLPGYESFSNAALEAMSLALPVVATTVGGFPEMITDGEHGLLIPPADPKALADAIKRLVRDAGMRNTLGNAARRRAAERLAPDRIAEQLERYLERVVETS